MGAWKGSSHVAAPSCRLTRRLTNACLGAPHLGCANCFRARPSVGRRFSQTEERSGRHASRPGRRDRHALLGAAAARERIEPAARHLNLTLLDRRRPGRPRSAGQFQRGNTLARLGAGHQKVELNRLACCGMPLCAGTLQFDGVRKTGCDDAHAVSSFCKYYGFNDDVARISNQQVHSLGHPPRVKPSMWVYQQRYNVCLCYEPWVLVHVR